MKITGNTIIGAFMVASIFQSLVGQSSAHATASYFLDAHFHYMEGHEGSYHATSKDYFNSTRFLMQSNVQMAFLISDSYHLNKRLDSERYGSRSRDESLAGRYDERTSKMVERFPSRFIGVCGANYDWRESDLMERVPKCLALPGMKGIKLHASVSVNSKGVSDPRIYRKIFRLLHTVESSKRFVLWHLKIERSMDPTVEPCSSVDLRRVFDMAKALPKLKFILAHSLYCPNLVREFIRMENGKRLENVFLETSASYMINPDAWTEFGWDRVLFGSDNDVELELERLQTRSGLSEQQMHQITNINGRRFVESLLEN